MCIQPVNKRYLKSKLTFTNIFAHHFERERERGDEDYEVLGVCVDLIKLEFRLVGLREMK